MSINDELRIREGETSQTYSKIYVDDDKKLHVVDNNTSVLYIVGVELLYIAELPNKDY